MGTPTLCLENWAKNVELKEKKVSDFVYYSILLLQTHTTLVGAVIFTWSQKNG